MKNTNSNYGNKYGNVLTMILVIVVVIILGIAGYFGYSVYKKNATNEAAQSALSEFEQATKTVRKKVKDDANNEVGENGEALVPDMSAYENAAQEQAAKQPEKVMYEGYEVKGQINIPKTGCKYPVLAEVTKHSLEVAVAILYGPGLNEPGNTVIVGHNYRNGLFFSNNSKLAIGDTIIITSPTETLNYKIYNMYYTTPDDASYMKRDVEEGVREISLSTCNNDSSQRLIIWAKEQGK